MSAVYGIADLHIGHNNVCRFRTQFSSVEEHDAYVIGSILSVCGKNDVLWLLGDCFFTEESLDYLRILRARVGQIKLVLGNHCSAEKGSQRFIKTMLDEGLIDKIHGLATYRGLWLSHAPVHESELRGKYNVYGHAHDRVIDDSRYLCISCEQVDYKPINFRDIKRILEETPARSRLTCYDRKNWSQKIKLSGGQQC
jgi:calcineurin-like phosphoesterase family protein